MQNIPLAERIRPQKLSEVIGQKHLIGDKGTLKTAINNIGISFPNNPKEEAL